MHHYWAFTEKCFLALLFCEVLSILWQKLTRINKISKYSIGKIDFVERVENFQFFENSAEEREKSCGTGSDHTGFIHIRKRWVKACKHTENRQWYCTLSIRDYDTGLKCIWVDNKYSSLIRYRKWRKHNYRLVSFP